MIGKFFLDTNIFVYSFDNSAPQKSARSAELIRDALQSGTGVVSFQVVQEFLNVALRRFAQPISYAEAEQYLSTVFRPLLAIHSSQSLYGRALQLSASHKQSWYDSLILASAIEGNCSVLYSEDLQHGRKFGGLQIENPYL